MIFTIVRCNDNDVQILTSIIITIAIIINNSCSSIGIMIQSHDTDTKSGLRSAWRSTYDLLAKELHFTV